MKNPHLVGYHAQLWELIIPMITPECLEGVKKTLFGYGWQI